MQLCLEGKGLVRRREPSPLHRPYKPIINKAQPERPRSVPKKLTPIVRTPSTLVITPRRTVSVKYTHGSAMADPMRDLPRPIPASLPTRLPPPGGRVATHSPPRGGSQPRGRPQCYPSPRRGRLDAYPPRENARGNPLTISRGSKVPRVKPQSQRAEGREDAEPAEQRGRRKLIPPLDRGYAARQCQTSKASACSVCERPAAVLAELGKLIANPRGGEPKARATR